MTPVPPVTYNSEDLMNWTIHRYYSCVNDAVSMLKLQQATDSLLGRPWQIWSSHWENLFSIWIKWCSECAVPHSWSSLCNWLDYSWPWAVQSFFPLSECWYLSRININDCANYFQQYQKYFGSDDRFDTALSCSGLYLQNTVESQCLDDELHM